MRTLVNTLLTCALLWLASVDSTHPDFIGSDQTIGALREDGVLRVLAVEGPSTYYQTAVGPKGPEYDLSKAFADSLGLDLQVRVVKNAGEALPLLLSGHYHLATAGLSPGSQSRQLVRTTPSIRESRQQVIYLRGNKRPRSTRDLVDRNLVVAADSSHHRMLEELKKEHHSLAWGITDKRQSLELLKAVWQGDLEMTIADSHLVALARQYYPELQVGFSLPGKESHSWTFSYNRNDELFAVARSFIDRVKENGQLERIAERYYGPTVKFNYVDIATFINRINTRLPDFIETFKRVGDRLGMDWRLLAAQSYQESRWNPDARSPTGVRGMMQLTRVTARELGIKDRRNPVQSIIGGGHYLKKLKNSLPEKIQEPDRTWYALAAYNIGRGHLLDARKISRKKGDNPDQWLNLQNSLPLLARKAWYKKTRHGFARGWEPVHYVNRIRIFYNILLRNEEEQLASERQQNLGQSLI